MEGKGKWANYPNALATTKDQRYSSMLTTDPQEHQISFFLACSSDLTRRSYKHDTHHTHECMTCQALSKLTKRLSSVSFVRKRLAKCWSWHTFRCSRSDSSSHPKYASCLDRLFFSCFFFPIYYKQPPTHASQSWRRLSLSRSPVVDVERNTNHVSWTNKKPC